MSTTFALRPNEVIELASQHRPSNVTINAINYLLVKNCSNERKNIDISENEIIRQIRSQYKWFNRPTEAKVRYSDLMKFIVYYEKNGWKITSRNYSSTSFRLLYSFVSVA